MSPEGLYNERVGDTERSSKIAVNPDKTSSRPIRAIGFLLILQAVGLVGIAIFDLRQVDWQQVQFEFSPQPQEGFEITEQEVGLEATRAIEVAVRFLPPAVLAILGALGFLVFSRRGWLLAALAQTLSLWACLQLYYEWNPGFIYPVMLYCILMVLYLNSHSVRVVFHSRRKLERQSAAGSGDIA
jgi:hypothetical protein